MNTLGTSVQSSPTASNQASEIETYYGVKAIAERGIVYIATEDWKKLCTAVWNDRNRQSIMRGYYLGGNGNVVLVSRWVMSVERVANLRARAKARKSMKNFTKAFHALGRLLITAVDDWKSSRGVSR